MYVCVYVCVCVCLYVCVCVCVCALVVSRPMRSARAKGPIGWPAPSRIAVSASSIEASPARGQYRETERESFIDPPTKADILLRGPDPIGHWRGSLGPARPDPKIWPGSPPAVLGPLPRPAGTAAHKTTCARPSGMSGGAREK